MQWMGGLSFPGRLVGKLEEERQRAAVDDL